MSRVWNIGRVIKSSCLNFSFAKMWLIIRCSKLVKTLQCTIKHWEILLAQSSLLCNYECISGITAASAHNRTTELKLKESSLKRRKQWFTALFFPLYLPIDWGGPSLWLIKINTSKRTQWCLLGKKRQQKGVWLFRFQFGEPTTSPRAAEITNVSENLRK